MLLCIFSRRHLLSRFKMQMILRRICSNSTTQFFPSFEHTSFTSLIWCVRTKVPCSHVVMAEWLRRWTRNPMGYSLTGSNPVHDEIFSNKIVNMKEMICFFGFVYNHEYHWCWYWFLINNNKNQRYTKLAMNEV